MPPRGQPELIEEQLARGERHDEPPQAQPLALELQLASAMGNQAFGRAMRTLSRQPQTVDPSQQRGPKMGPFPDVNTYVRHKKGKLGEPLGRVKTGDKLVAEVHLTKPLEPGADKAIQLSPDAGIQTGQVRWPKRDLVEIDFEATALGLLKFGIIVEPHDDPATFMRTEAWVDVEMDKQAFLNRCAQATTSILSADQAMRVWLATISIAYREAYRQHTGALKQQADKERLMQELLLNAALAFVPGGLGGVIGATMKRAVKSDFIIDGIKDLAKFGMRQAGQVGMQGGVKVNTDAGLQAYPLDPENWADKETIRVTSELRVVTETVKNWQEKVNSDEPTFIEDFDPIEAIDKSMTIDGKPVKDLDKLDGAKLAEDYEKGMWAKWLEQYGYKIELETDKYDTDGYPLHDTASAEKNVGDLVMKRIAKLKGFDPAPFMATAKKAKEAEAHEYNEANKPGPSLAERLWDWIWD